MGSIQKLGLLLYAATGITLASSGPVEVRAESAAAQDPAKQLQLGLNYEKGAGVPKNYEMAASWYRKSADAGNKEAADRLVLLLAQGKITLSKEEFFPRLLTSARGDFMIAQALVGDCYYQGTGVTKNANEAFDWYSKAAKQGSYLAMEGLARAYYKGDGVVKDQIEGLAWQNIAASSGFAEMIKCRDLMEVALGRDATLQSQQRSKELLKSMSQPRN